MLLRSANLWPAVVLCATTGQAFGQPVPFDGHGDPLPPCAVARLGTVRWRHPATVATLAFSPNGTLLASAGAGVVSVWDTSTGRPVPRFSSRVEADAVAFSPDGKLLVAARGDGTLQLRDSATGTLLREHRPAQRLERLRPVFAPDRSRVALLDGGDALRLVDVATGRDALVLRDPQGMLAAAVSHDGKTLASGGENEVIHLREVGTAREVRTLKGRAGWVFTLCFSPDDRALAGATGEEVRLWDVATGTVLHTLPATGARMAFAPDGRTLAGHSGGEVVLWEVATGRQVRRFGGRAGDVVELAFSADGRTLAVAFCGRAIELWDVATGKRNDAPDGHRGAIGSLSFSHDGSVLATGSRDDRTVVVWDLTTKAPRCVCADGASSVVSTALSPDGGTLAAGDAFPAPGATETAIRLWDTRERKLLRRIAAHRSSVDVLAFAPDGNRLASAAEDGVRLWDAAGAPVRDVSRDEGRSTVAFSLDGQRFLTFGTRGRIAFWQPANGEHLRTFAPVGELGSSVPYAAFLSDGKTFMTWWPGEGRELRFRDVASGETLRSFFIASRLGNDTPCALSPDGKLFVHPATGPGAAPVIRIWDTEVGKVMSELSGHTGAVLALSFSADGKWLASGSEDTTALLWDVKQFRLEHLWAELAGSADDAAARKLADLGATAVPFLAHHLRDAAGREGVAARLVIDLDADDFETREQASADLARLGAEGEYVLRLVLAGKPSAEVRRRVVVLLEEMHSDPKGLSALHARRTLRAVAILEAIGTKPAREALRNLSRGRPKPA
jgi:WD40 repeat protein